MDQQSENITQEERLYGLFVHLSMFFGSLVIPFVFWVINKDKSKFVTFHSLQALFFHIAYTIVIVFLVIFVAAAGLAVGLIVPGYEGPPKMDAMKIIVLVAIAIVVIGFIGTSVIISLINAFSAYKGGMKKYPIIGNMVYKRVYGLN